MIGRRGHGPVPVLTRQPRRAAPSDTACQSLHAGGYDRGHASGGLASPWPRRSWRRATGSHRAAVPGAREAQDARRHDRRGALHPEYRLEPTMTNRDASAGTSEGRRDHGPSRRFEPVLSRIAPEPSPPRKWERRTAQRGCGPVRSCTIRLTEHGEPGMRPACPRIAMSGPHPLVRPYVVRQSRQWDHLLRSLPERR